MEGAERSGHIVDALKRFSAVEENTRQRVDWPISPSAPCTGSAVPFRVEVINSGLDAPAWVCGSANQLQQVLVNLIQNAFDAIEKTCNPGWS
jgi:two-component system sensor histidine kinase HupT/HoxJ